MSDVGLWPELALRLFLAGTMLSVIGASLALVRIHREDRVQQTAFGWAVVVFLLLLSRFAALAAASDVTTVYSSRLQYSLMLLQVPLSLYLVEGAASRRRWILPSSIALSVFPITGSAFATDRVVHHPDAFGANVGYALPGPLAHAMIPYGILAGVYIARCLAKYQGADASLVRAALLGVVFAVLPSGTNDFLMTLGVTHGLLLMDISSCFLVLVLGYVLSRRSHDAYQTLLTAVDAQREELRRGAAEIRTENRLAELGAEVGRVLERVREPVDRITTALVVAQDAVLAIPTGGDPRWLEEREVLAECRDATQRVKRTIGAFGELVGSGVERVVPTDLVALVERALAIVGNEIRHRGRLVKDMHPVPLVDADPERLVQALVSLLVRAVRAIPVRRASAGRVAVSVTQAKRHVVVRISDNGTPIPPALVPLVFDPYVATDPDGAGSGLGLALCHRLVTRLGGKVSVASTEQGSEIVLELPIHDNPSPPRAAALA